MNLLKATFAELYCKAVPNVSLDDWRELDEKLNVFELT